MNTTFFKLAFRSILKNRLNSIINIVGFSLGIAACLFIFLFVKHETSFDTFYPNCDRLYRLVGTFNSKDNTDLSGFTWFPAAPDIKKEIPGIDAYCRVTGENTAKCFAGKHLFEIDKFRFADENFFPFFHFKLITGNPETILNSAEKIVLTGQTALKLFGSTDVIGKELMYQHQLFTISGIAANPPANTQISFDALASVKYIEQSDNFWKGWGGGITFLSYLQLAENVSPQQVEKALPDLLNRKVNEKWKDSGSSLSIALQNISKVHLADGTIQYDCSSNRNKKSIYIIACISLLILILAIVNYIILYTAQKNTKSKDIGVLKIHGAGKYGLMAQTYAEVLIVSAFSSALGILLLALSLPFLNSQLQTTVVIGTNMFPALGFIVLTILLLSAVVTFFSTRKIVSLKPIEVLKNKASINGSGTFENYLLVSFQFTIVILLLISGFIVSRQNSFLLNQELGFNKENILTIESDEEFLHQELFDFKQDLQRLAAVRSVSLSSQTVGKGLTQNGYRIEGQQESSMINVVYTDADFLNCFDVHLVEGRNFSLNSSLDKDAILINQQLKKKAGWDDPLNKTINRNGKLKVIGVVNDFNFASLENSVQPLLIMSNPGWDGWGYSTVNIRFQTSNVQGLISQINQLWKDRFPETPFKVSFLDDVLASNYNSLKAQQRTINFFSLLGTFIAVLGLFGLSVFTTKRRIKEIGIRKVNGATISEVMAMLNRDFVKWVAIAFVIATPIAYYAMNKWLENFAYKTELSWWIFVLAGFLALGIALLTVSWQSWKAATRNPVEALRYE
ncbi:MAG: ABC transporter permease [Bacteroidota bacterium]|nr:ABC transporter permease [Bacteroidota bacterium]